MSIALFLDVTTRLDLIVEANDDHPSDSNTHTHTHTHTHTVYLSICSVHVMSCLYSFYS